MREVRLDDATPALALVVEQAIAGDDVVVTRGGRKEAVIVSWATWKRLSEIPSFGRLLASSPLEDGDIPDRNRVPLRDAGL